MHKAVIFIHEFAYLLVGIGLGYAFRGLVNRGIHAVIAYIKSKI